MDTRLAASRPGLQRPELLPFYRDRSVLVTGGAGFIGRHLLERLTALGARTYSLDLTATVGRPLSQQIIADIRQTTMADFRNDEPEMIFHLAAVVGIKESWADPVLTFTTNSYGTGRLLSICGQLGVKRFCLMSSSAIYGEPDSVPIGEDNEPKPRSVYAWSKVCAEQLLVAHSRYSPMAGVIIRPFNVYGPWQSASFVIPRFLHQAIEEKPLTVVGDGKQRRTFTYIDDLLEGVLLAMTKARAGCTSYNIAGRNTVTIAQLAAMIITLTGSRGGIEHRSIRDLQRHPLSEIVDRIPSIAKAGQDFDFQPRVDLEAGLRLTLNAMESS